MKTERQLEVLKRFEIIDPAGEFIQRRLLRPEDKPLGYGPKLHPFAADRLLNCDTSAGQVWLDWIFHQAAGGDSAKEASDRAMENMKQRFTEEHTSQMFEAMNPERTKLTPEQAEETWKRNEPWVREVLYMADQDVVERLGVLGFYRNWPGRDNLYARIEDAVLRWQELSGKVTQMNEELAREDKELMSRGPSDVADIDKLEAQIKRVNRYFASKKARSDVRVAKHNGQDYVYNDEYVSAVVPLTYAASVRYGCDGWLFSNRDQFERVLLEDQSYADAWKASVSRGKAYVFIRFKCPVPRWVTRQKDKFKIHELTNLAMEVSGQEYSQDSTTFINEEGSIMSYRDVVRRLMDEPNRSPDADDMPIKRGKNAYTSLDEANEVVRHFDLAISEIARWLPSFDAKLIVSDALATMETTKPSAEAPAE